MLLHNKKSLFIKGILAFTSLGIFFIALSVIQTEEPLPRTPSLVQGVTTETAKPAFLVNPNSITPADKLPAAPVKPTRPIVQTPKPAPQVKIQSIVEPEAGCSGNFTEEFICLLNDYRASKGVARLSYAADLAKVAQAYSNWMSASATFSHIDADGNNFVKRCAKAGITCYAENLAVDFTSASHLLNLWQASPSHNENLLRNLSSVGLGITNEYATLLLK